jgi:hypothetical protein
MRELGYLEGRDYGSRVAGILFRLEGLTGKQMEIALDLVPGAARWAF